MGTNNRWTPAALSAAVFVLYFTPWLMRRDGSEPTGFALSKDLFASVAGLDRSGLSTTVAPLLAWAIPLLALGGLVQCARGRTRWAGALLAAAVLSVIGLGLSLSSFVGRTQPVAVDFTLGGFAVAGAALALVALAAKPRAGDPPLGITERRRDDGTVAIHVSQNRWRPLHRLLYIVVNTAILLGALALWAQDHFPAIAPVAMPPVAGISFVAVALAGVAVSLAASRRAPRARIVIDRTTLTVVAGGERGRYPRSHIGGIYIPQQTDASVSDYYDNHRGKHTLTLPVSLPKNGSAPAARSVSLFADSGTRVVMNLRNRSVDLARHLTQVQATELVRRLMVRLLD